MLFIVCFLNSSEIDFDNATLTSIAEWASSKFDPRDL